jgi:uncharacterized RDD family membrane protein YckC
VSGTATPSDPVGRAAFRQVPSGARAYQGHRAGIVSRVLAAAVDVLVVVVLLVGVWLGFTALRFLRAPRQFTFPAPGLTVAVVAFEVLAFAYLAVAWATMGRTLGADLMGLRVVDRHGRQLGWVWAALRAAFCVLFVIGLAWVAVSRQNRSVQDVVLRTSVIYDWVHTATPVATGTHVDGG